MAALLTGLVSSTLYAQRTRQASLSAQKLAASVAPFFASADLEALADPLALAAAEAEGRVLLIDASGKVQMDTLALLEGTRITVPEAVQVLSGEESRAYGIHPLDADATEYAAFCAAAMTKDGEIIGAVLLSTPVTELRQAIQTVEKQLMTVFLAVAAAALIAALIFAVTLTAPIKALNSTIRRMGKGDLSARVHVRTSGELKALADSYNAMAEKIENFDQSRSQFVQNASHELKTPLATMKILLENLIYQPDMPAELRAEFMQDMNHEIDRLSGIITDLLTLTQMDSNVTLKREPVDLSALCEETLHALTPAADKAGLVLRADIARDVILPGDASKLGQVAYNLIDNAIKYTPAGGQVDVTLNGDSRQVILTVKDTGIGIPEEDSKHIFERFYRVDKARSRATGGTGLGLSIVRQMVQLHGGTIAVESAAGQGSTFTVTLPVGKGDA